MTYLVTKPMAATPKLAHHMPPPERKPMTEAEMGAAMATMQKGEIKAQQKHCGIGRQKFAHPNNVARLAGENKRDEIMEVIRASDNGMLARELADAVSITRATLSHHMQRLIAEGRVDALPAGNRKVIYREKAQ